MSVMVKTTLEPNKGNDPAKLADSLIGDVYRAPLQPERYDELIVSWDKLLTGLITTDNGAASHVEDNLSEFAPHFDRSYEALIRIGRHHSTHQLIDCDPRPSLGLNTDGQVTHLNHSAQLLLGITQGDPISAYLDQESAARLELHLVSLPNLEQGATESLNLILRNKINDDSFLMACVPSNEHPLDHDTRARLVALQLNWSDAIGKWLQTSFKLSEAETEVLKSVVSGHSLNELAVNRNRSIETIRSQLKSLLRKTNLSSQIDLVKLFAGFDHLPEELKVTARHKSASGVHSEFHKLADGRLLQYDVFGPEDGNTVIFLHGMLEGTGPTTVAQNLLVEHNLKLVCPWRPSFAGSDASDCDPQEMPDSFADDVVSLLDELGVRTCPVIGHLAGSLYGYALAAQHPSRVSGLVNVAGAVPMISDEQIRMMSTRQRIIAFSGKYTPRLLPFILRAALAQIDSGGVGLLVDAMYSQSPADQKVVSRSEVAESIYNGYLSSVAQGHRGFQRDGEQVLKDWSHYISNTTVPVELIHGQQDPTVKIETVRDACRQHPELNLTEVDDVGQLIFYDRPDLVLEVVARMMGAAVSRPK